MSTMLSRSEKFIPPFSGRDSKPATLSPHIYHPVDDFFFFTSSSRPTGLPSADCAIMFVFTRNHLLHVARRRPLRGFAASASISQVIKGKANRAKTNSFCSKNIAYATGGTSLAIAGLLWSGRGEGEDVEDPRDKMALSSVPLSKLLSGWV